LGLGLLYDRLIWEEVSEIPSPVFKAFDRVWKNKFSKNLNIDQRLINPDITRDKEFGLVRLQTYGHAKAGAFLSELRSRIGSSKFDDYVKFYLARPEGSPIEYEGFLALFAEDDLKIVRMVESEFTVR